jgi:hypothetical protein
MSQAEKPNNMSRLSRRNALAGLAGIAAGGAAALPAAAGVLNSEHSDADLLAMAPRFDPLYAEWQALSVAQYLDHVDFDAELVRRTGLTRDQVPGPVPDREDIPDHPFWGEFEKINADGIGNRVDCDRWDLLTTELYPLADEILEFRAATREGLALQVKAFMASYNEHYAASCWELEGDEDDDDPAKAALRWLLASLCNSVGVQWPPYDLTAKTAVSS